MEQSKKRKPASSASARSLSEGDQIEYSLSVEVRGPRGSVWVKFGTTSAVQSGESESSALDRVSKLVEGTIARKIEGIQAS